MPLPDKVLLTALSPSRGAHPTCTCVCRFVCVPYTGMHMEAAFWVLESQEGEDRPGPPCRVALIVHMCRAVSSAYCVLDTCMLTLF